MTPNGSGRHAIPSITNASLTAIDNGAVVMAAKYGIHKLRHAAASLFIQHLGWSPKRVQIVMGHSSIQMTFDLYGHLSKTSPLTETLWRKSKPPWSPPSVATRLQQDAKIVRNFNGGARFSNP
jgi:integrase